MKLSDLDQPITIRRMGAFGENAFGEKIAHEVEPINVMAQCVQSAGREYLSGEAIAATARKVFRIHWMAGLTTKDQVIHDGESHNIREIRPLGRQRFLELHTEVAP